MKTLIWLIVCLIALSVGAQTPTTQPTTRSVILRPIVTHELYRLIKVNRPDWEIDLEHTDRQMDYELEGYFGQFFESTMVGDAGGLFAVPKYD